MDFSSFLEMVIPFLTNLVAAIIIFVASLLLSKLASQWTEKSAKEKIKDPEITRLLSRLARWSVIVLGTLAALEQVNFDVTSFLAGLGIAGITVGFALQDIARNFVAGILVLLRQPFEIGDAVEVAGHAGTVMDVNLRDTEIKTWDGVMEILPNIDVFSNPIVNYSRLPDRRRTIQIGLGYGQDVDRSKEVFLQALRSVDGVLEEPTPNILAEELGNSAISLAARFWVNQKTHDLFETHSRAVQAINTAAEREGIDLPYPIQTVRVEGGWPQVSGS